MYNKNIVLHLCINYSLKQKIMGTRATYRFINTYTYKDEKTQEIKKGKNVHGLIYTQMDGYPDGVPLNFIDFIAGGKMVNGIGLSETNIIFNGMSCLMAQLIAKFKTGPGQLYIYPVNHRGLCGENYLYDIIFDDDTNEFTINVFENYSRKRKLFSGNLEEYINKYA